MSNHCLFFCALRARCIKFCASEHFARLCALQDSAESVYFTRTLNSCSRLDEGIDMRQKDPGLMERIKLFAEEYALKNGGKTPSMTEIGSRFGSSRSGAFGYLKAMDQRGMIRYENGMIHTDVIDKVEEPSQLCKGYTEGITAGTPEEVEGYVDSYFPIPPMFLDGRKGNFFTLEVIGDSMIDAGIDPGDLVICRECEEARECCIYQRLRQYAEALSCGPYRIFSLGGE